MQKIATILSAMLVSYTAVASAQPIQVIVHSGICNEVRIASNEEQGVRWYETSGGGRFNINDFTFKELKQNELSKVTFAKGCADRMFEKCDADSSLTFHFKGAQIASTSLPENQYFSVSNNSLSDSKTDAVIGKANILINSDRTTDLMDPTADFGKRHRIVLAALYVNTIHPSNLADVNCAYVNKDINLSQINAGQCLWIDKNSKPSNGLPYCW